MLTFFQASQTAYCFIHSLASEIQVYECVFPSKTIICRKHITADCNMPKE